MTPFAISNEDETLANRTRQRSVGHRASIHHPSFECNSCPPTDRPSGEWEGALTEIETLRRFTVTNLFFSELTLLTRHTSIS